MDYLPAEPRQEAETAIITTTTSTIRPVINRGSVCVCIMCLQCVCVQWKWLKVVQRGGNTRERRRDYRRGRETFLLLPIKYFKPQSESFSAGSLFKS